MIARRHASSAEDTESSCTPRPAQSTMSSRSSRHCCSSAATRAPAAGAATTARAAPAASPASTMSATVLTHREDAVRDAPETVAEERLAALRISQLKEASGVVKRAVAEATDAVDPIQ